VHHVAEKAMRNSEYDCFCPLPNRILCNKSERNRLKSPWAKEDGKVVVMESAATLRRISEFGPKCEQNKLRGPWYNHHVAYLQKENRFVLRHCVRQCQNLGLSVVDRSAAQRVGAAFRSPQDMPAGVGSASRPGNFQFTEQTMSTAMGFRERQTFSD